MSPRTLYSISDNPYRLDKRIAKGGEGEIYSVRDFPNLLIKIYFQNRLQGKEVKIREMIPLCSESLKKFAAPPIESLYDSNGNFVGFLMDFVDGEIIPHLYWKERFEKYPKARWHSFIKVVKNLAIAVHNIHEEGFIIGDINESNILFKTTVKFIDFDSLQFQGQNGRHFYCDVRRPEYTPPELQDLDGQIWRVRNHDYFGLAVLIFQILFIGRHPFTGIPTENQFVETWQAIKDHRFAFGFDSKTRGWLPPPYILKLEEVSKPIEELFRRAFLKVANRPSALEWIEALENLEKNLATCEANNGHFYPNSISECPWCRIEEESNYQVIHFDPLSFDTNFNLDAVWKEICSLNPPSKQKALPEKSYYELHGIEKLKAQINRYVTLKIGICLAVFLVHFGLLVLITEAEIGCAIILALILSFVTGSIIFAILESDTLFPKLLSAEKKQLQQQNKQLLEDYESLNAKRSFTEKFRELETKKDDYLDLGTFRANRFQELERKARERQEIEFLSKFRISDASIYKIGYSRTLTLRSFGIETAAELTRNSIYQIPGFNYTLASYLLAWKEKVRKSFVFDPSRALTEADKIAVEREVYRRKIAFERDLKQGKKLLTNTIQNAELKERQLYEKTKVNLQKLIVNEYKFAPTISSLVAKVSIAYLILSTIAMIVFVVSIQREKGAISTQTTNSANASTKTTKNSPEATQSPMIVNANSNFNTNVSNANVEESDDVIAYKQGIAQTRAGKFKEAVEFYEKAILLNPKYAQAYHELGYALLKLGKYKESVEASKEAITLKPKNPETYKNLASAYQSLNDLEKACENLGKVRDLMPNNFQAVSNLSKCYIQQGKNDEAIKSYKDAIRINPRNANARYELGRLYNRLGRSEDAMDEYTELLKLNPSLANKLAEEMDLNQ